MKFEVKFSCEVCRFGISVSLVEALLKNSIDKVNVILMNGAWVLGAAKEVFYPDECK